MNGSLFPGQFSPVPGGFQDLAVGATAAPLTLPTGPKGVPKYALMQVLGSNINWRDDGVAPVAGDGGGMFLAATAEPIGFSGNLSTAEFISSNSGGSTLLVSYYY